MPKIPASRSLLPLLLALLSSCAQQVATPVAAPAAFVAPTSLPAVTGAPIPLNVPSGATSRGTAFYYGTGAQLGPGRMPALGALGAHTDLTGSGITLNFDNANVRDVAKAVLGDLLTLNYEIDPSVQGTITLGTASPVDRTAVLAIFEQSLLLAGLALVQDQGEYRIVPVADAPREAGAPLIATPGGAVSPGFGLEIVPLRYVAAAQMQTLLNPLIPNGSILSIDSSRNILTIAGTAEQREAILNDVALFDVDQMAGKSFALFRPEYVGAADLAHGLQAIIAGPDGQGIGGVVQLITLDHLNAVLAISTQPRYLNELQDWVVRLDQPSDSASQQLYVYQVQNGKAADLAAVLSKAFGAETAAPETAAAPGDHQAMISDPAAQALLGPLPGNRQTPPALPNAGANDASQAPAAADDNPPSAAAGPLPVSITADTVNNALLIRCLPVQYSEIQQALRALDIQPLQVLIEASVAEVTLTNQMQYGIQYYFHGGSTKVIQTTATSQAVSAALPGFAAIFQGGQTISAILSALQAVTNVNVLSAPELMVLNNQTASLQVGDEVPIATEQSQSTLQANAPVINSIQYENTGVILKVTPRVNADGLVTMDISQEVSGVSATTSSTLNSPTISERLISSTVAIHDGQTVALGGLISDNRTNGRSGIPLLDTVPYVGALFSNTNNQVTRTELLVLLTPHVVGNQDQAQAVTDELRAKLSGTLPALAAGK